MIYNAAFSNNMYDVSVFHNKPQHAGRVFAMLTWIMLILTGMFVVNRWIQYYRIKRNDLPLEHIDTEFRNELNAGDSHEK
jgi:ABC-type transport system involved in multi-copper enzyme maturation permease subunit